MRGKLIAFGWSKDYFLKKVEEFDNVSIRAVIRIYKQWQNFQNTNNSCENCGKKALTDRDEPSRSFRVLQFNLPLCRQELLQNVNFGPSPLTSESIRFCHLLYLWITNGIFCHRFQGEGLVRWVKTVTEWHDEDSRSVSYLFA